ncbi:MULTISPECIES: hypothetical protein [Pseudomonas]|uniref:Uncharacterized protein n=1 Tax=Pseudomonas baetica TaxID=674054 RepID=A0ABX4PW90_9PSED|nr:MULTISPECIES: hypothetical protein [Pseudomonas]PKA69321.1 hypothetical protein ATI02_2157 [Pseudomonas baetica]PTC20866.1 hypothetical protein C0J26_05055 [Pseudomonas baetica]
MTNKSFAITMLPAPLLIEANDGVLYVHNLVDPAHGEVPVYPGAAKGDAITLTVSNSDGINEWEGKEVLSSATIEKPILFKIPKAPFEKMLDAKKSAVLQYSVKHANGNQAASFQTPIELKN